MNSYNYPIVISGGTTLLAFMYLHSKKKNLYKQIIGAGAIGLLTWLILYAYVKYNSSNVTQTVSPAAISTIDKFTSNDTVTQMSLRQ